MWVKKARRKRGSSDDANTGRTYSTNFRWDAGRNHTSRKAFQPIEATQSFYRPCHDKGQFKGPLNLCTRGRGLQDQEQLVNDMTHLCRPILSAEACDLLHLTPSQLGLSELVRLAEPVTLHIKGAHLFASEFDDPDPGAMRVFACNVCDRLPRFIFGQLLLVS